MIWVGFTIDNMLDIKDKLKKIDSNKKTTKINYTIKLPLVGDMKIKNIPLFISTSLIALVDGFNPCSLWVLSFLIGFLIHSNSRKKMILTGITFLFVTSIIYGLFIIGVLNTLIITKNLFFIKFILGIITLFIEIVNIKDYFFFKKLITFSIPEKFKPRIYNSLKNIFKKNSKRQIFFSTILVASGITIIELPCTAGFPVLWSNLISNYKINTVLYFLLLALYLFIYLIDEIILLITSIITLRASKITKQKGKKLKLLSGIIMVVLSFVLIFNPKLMNNLFNMIFVFLISLVLFISIMILKQNKLI